MSITDVETASEKAGDDVVDEVKHLEKPRSVALIPV